MLAGGLRDELLEPQPEAGQRLGDDERELVAPGLREGAQGRPQPHRRAAARSSPSRRQSPSRLLLEPVSQALGAPSKQREHGDPHQRARHDAEGGQRAVAPADVRVAGERPPEGVLGGERFQARAGVGDRDEPLPSSTSEKKCANSDSGSIVPPDFDETTNSVRCEVDRALDRADPGGVRRVQHVQRARSGRAGSGPLGPNERRRTSGASEEPPMPSSTMSRSSSSCASAANSSSAPSSPSIRSAIVSQPRRLATSGVPDGHPTASRLRGRSCRPHPPRRPARACPRRRPGERRECGPRR